LRIHLSTLLIAVILAGGFIGLNLMEGVGRDNVWRGDPPRNNDASICRVCGWPWAFQYRRLTFSGELMESEPVVWNVLGAFGDTLIALAVIGVVCVRFEYGIRLHREKAERDREDPKPPYPSI
jgi:hypothetical protein